MTLDENSIGRSNRDVEHERAVAIYDLIEDNVFRPSTWRRPVRPHYRIAGNRLVFDIREADGTPVVAHPLSLAPFSRIVKDYFTVCDSYYEAIRTATPDRNRGARHGPPLAARRGLAHPHGAAAPQGRNRLRYRAAAVHAGLVLHWKG